MTAAAILFTFLASVILYRWTAWDGYLFGLSLYVLTFLAGLLTASTFALRTELISNSYKFRDNRAVLGILVLWLNFIGSHIASNIGDPNLWIAGTLDVLTAAYFVLYGITRWEWVIGGIYCVSALLGLLSFVGIVPGSEERIASGFIVFSYPDLANAAGMIAVAVLGLGAGDTGRRVRLTLRAPVPWARAA